MTNVEIKPFLGRMKGAFRGIGESISEARRMRAEHRRRFPHIID